MDQSASRPATWIVRELRRTSPLRASEHESIDTLWTLMEPAVHARLVRRLGWSRNRYERWFATSAEHLLVPDRKEKTHEPPPGDPSATSSSRPRTSTASIAFYEAVLGWHGESAHASFEAPGLIGQWTTDLTPSPGGAGAVVRRRRPLPHADARHRERRHRRGDPVLDQGERWLVEVEDPSGNRLGLVAPLPLPGPRPC